MANHEIRYTSAEIGALWTTYLQTSATSCFYKHFLHYLKDDQIKNLIEEALSMNNDTIKALENMFTEEKFPIPHGFSDEDVNLTAPALFTELFALSFVYRAGQVIMNYFSMMMGKVARKDVYKFYEKCLSHSTELYEKSLNLMLAKGIYDRPANIDYPKGVEYLQHSTSILEHWLGQNRPLNCLELSELFFSIERNSIGLVLLNGLIQVTKDPEIKEFLKKGMKLSEKQIDTYNEILKESYEFPTSPVPLEVTNSRISPFSDRLIMFFINSSNQLGLTSISYAMSVSIRKDLAVHYSRFIAEIMKYGAQGLEIMVKRGFMEKPPESTDRKNLQK
ncbi:DUF3231 family protein [Peribacillus alkalitolerans]|uniref:DUF3231 family protein n=1 Tax=Peribacillus alkalitolerans TaxID=1550385 RepID=UPI0013D342F8|nr:DUF3231 family protein [Peribacillus alkalitolerans]